MTTNLEEFIGNGFKENDTCCERTYDTVRPRKDPSLKVLTWIDLPTVTPTHLP